MPPPALPLLSPPASQDALAAPALARTWLQDVLLGEVSKGAAASSGFEKVCAQESLLDELLDQVRQTILPVLSLLHSYPHARMLAFTLHPHSKYLSCRSISLSHPSPLLLSLTVFLSSSCPAHHIQLYGPSCTKDARKAADVFIVDRPTQPSQQAVGRGTTGRTCYFCSELGACQHAR